MRPDDFKGKSTAKTVYFHGEFEGYTFYEDKPDVSYYTERLIICVPHYTGD
jgi:hypothetical protein